MALTGGDDPNTACPPDAASIRNSSNKLAPAAIPFRAAADTPLHIAVFQEKLPAPDGAPSWPRFVSCQRLRPANGKCMSEESRELEK